MSRQFTRQIERRVAKEELRVSKLRDRKAAKSALLARQTEREKAGFYSSRGTVANMTGSRSTPIKDRKISKRKPFGRTLHSQVIDGVEISYHATKGWRRHAA